MQKRLGRVAQAADRAWVGDAYDGTMTGGSYPSGAKLDIQPDTLRRRAPMLLFVQRSGGEVY
jgi:hypothetical protein